MTTKKYPPVGRCIYCQKTASEAEMSRLQDEHIIAYSLGGSLLLPEASCAKCGAKTGADEGYCAGQMLKEARAHFHWQSRKSKRPDKLVAGRIVDGAGSWWDIPLNEHPPLIALPEFNPPGIITRSNPEVGGITIVGINMHMAAEFHERLKKLGKGGSTFSALEVDRFCRMLAKIGHAFAVAEVGYGAFKPFLPEVILDHVPYFSHVVGSTVATGALSADLHELSFFWSLDLLICRVRLFARFGLGPYLVVCGRRP